jgi:hypothetical protein
MTELTRDRVTWETTFYGDDNGCKLVVSNTFRCMITNGAGTLYIGENLEDIKNWWRIFNAALEAMDTEELGMSGPYDEIPGLPLTGFDKISLDKSLDKYNEAMKEMS